MNYRKTIQCILHMCYTKLQIVLHKTTNRTTQNYRLYYTKLRYTDNSTDKISAHTTDTNQVSCTQIQHSDVAMYNLHTKLT